MKTLYANSTRGGLYSIALQVLADGTYCIREFKHNREQGAAFLGNADAFAAVREYNKRIDDAATYDGIFYTKDLHAFLGAQ
jgi:hypothetical protein